MIQENMEKKLSEWFNKNKYYILGVVLLILIFAAAVSVVFYLKVKNAGVDTSPINHKDPTAGWQTYSNKAMGFVFKHPEELNVYQPTDSVTPPSYYIPVCDSETMLACLVYPEEKYKGTNFEGGGFSVNLIRSAGTEKKCATYRGETLIDYRLINGIKFYSTEDGTGAAGHKSLDRVYRTMRGENCFEVVLRVNESQFANYEPGTIKEFTADDEKVVFNLFTNVLKTFNFSEKNAIEKDSRVGQFCGGIAGKACPTGYNCAYDGDYPDSGGICVKKPAKSGACIQVITRATNPIDGKIYTFPTPCDVPEEWTVIR
jgi:hypothetical protein